MSSDYVTLMGAEDVRCAANAIRSAAEDMRQTVGYFEDSLFRQRQFMDEWLERFREIMEKKT